jgi:hypothetical protein
VYDHLLADGNAPWEYIELILCRDVYHCTPMELADVPLNKIINHLTCIGVENKVASMRAEEMPDE